MFQRHILLYTLLIHLPLFQAKQGDYFRGPSALSYCESVKYCKRNGGELAVIRNQEQNTAAADICSVNLNPKSKSGNNDNNKQTDEKQRICKSKKTKKLCRKENDCDWHTKKYAREEGCYHEDTVERAEDYKDDMEDNDQYDKAGKNVPCWLGLTEYVGTENTEIDYQLWIWRDGNASTLPKGQVYDNKARTYSLGYMDDMNHTTTFNATDDNTTTLLTKPNNKKGVPLSSYEYDNWQVCLACSDKENSMEPNNYMGCSESHAFMGSDTADLGKWYDVNAHKYVKYLPLCENTTHENPIHDHQCDTTFSYCWYEQCRNTDVGQDDSKCWSKKDLTSPPKCSESATPKYTELEMKYDGEVYVEYTCCDDNDDSGREKHGICYDNNYHRYDNSIVGALIAMLLLLICVVSALCVCFYCIHHHHNKNYTHNRHINNSNAINVNNSNNQFGAVQMIRVSTPQTVQVTLPANAVPGQSIRVALPSGQHMQVTVPVGATGGSTLTVQYQSPGPSTSSYTNRGAVPIPITPQNRDVPQLPQHDWNDKSSGAHVIPQGYGGASKDFTTTPGNGMVTPMVVSIPRVVAQPVQPMQMQMVPQQNV